MIRISVIGSFTQALRNVMSVFARWRQFAANGQALYRTGRQITLRHRMLMQRRVFVAWHSMSAEARGNTRRLCKQLLLLWNDYAKERSRLNACTVFVTSKRDFRCVLAVKMAVSCCSCEYSVLRHDVS